MMKFKASEIVAFRYIYERENEAMSDNYNVINNLNAWRANLDILIQHLDAAEKDASREAVFVLLLQGLGLFGGPEGPMMHLFPVVDSIRSKIDKSDLDGALRQAILLQQQLDEVRALVCSGAASAMEGAHSAQECLFDAEEEP